MIKYAIQNNAGHFLLPNYSGFTPYIEKALLSDDRTKLDLLMKGTLRKVWRPLCSVVEINIDEEELVENAIDVVNTKAIEALTNLSLHTTTTHEGLVLAHKQLKALCKTLSSIASKHDYYVDQQSHYDTLLSDLYHEVEFNNLNAKESAEVVKKMQGVLKQRRQAKDMVGITSMILSGDFKTLQRIGAYLNMLDSREYHPRNE